MAVSVLVRLTVYAVGREAGRDQREETYRSGLLKESMTAAMGIPKLETGPQKSAVGQHA